MQDARMWLCDTDRQTALQKMHRNMQNRLRCKSDSVQNEGENGIVEKKKKRS